MTLPDMLKDMVGFAAWITLMAATLGVIVCIFYAVFCCCVKLYRWTKKPRRQKEKFTMEKRFENERWN